MIEVLLRCNSRSWLGQLVAHRVSFSGELQLEINEPTKKKEVPGSSKPGTVTGCLLHATAPWAAATRCAAPRPLTAALHTARTPLPPPPSQRPPRAPPRAAGGLGGGEGRGVSEAPDGSGAARHRVTPPCPEVRRQRRWSGGQRPGCTGAASGRSATGGELGAVRCGQR